MKVLKRLKKNNGETLVETLVALMITALGLLMLPGAVVAAARVNAISEKQVIYMEKTLEADAGVDAGKCDVTFSVGGNSGTVEDVKVLRFGTEETGLYEIGLTGNGD